MKRMIAFFVVVAILIGIKFINRNNLPNFEFEKLVVISQVSNLFDQEKIQNGNQFYYTFDKINGKNIIKNLDNKDFDGLVYYFNKSVGIDRLKNKFDFVYKGKENIQNLQIYYGYDSDYPDFVFLNGKKVNVQLVENSTNIIVGFPMILCGY